MILLDLLLELNPADMTINRKWADGKRLNPVYRQLKLDLRQACREQRLGVTRGPVVVEVTFCGKCDIDAPLKLILDALQRSVVHDDDQVVELHVHKEPEGEPCLHILVSMFERAR